ncbi:hypothetical protein U1Q18_026400 [Sarracenia purpurea var. burkii]
MNKTKFNNVYAKYISESTTEEDLKTLFGEYGIITSVVVMRDGDGKSKCFGFVNFENADDVAIAIEALNGKKFNDKEWYVFPMCSRPWTTIILWEITPSYSSSSGRIWLPAATFMLVPCPVELESSNDHTGSCS